VKWAAFTSPSAPGVIRQLVGVRRKHPKFKVQEKTSRVCRLVFSSSKSLQV